jgi:hypothetical protein
LPTARTRDRALVAIALVTVRAGIVASNHTNWPLGFYLGVIAVGFFPGRRGRAPAPSARKADFVMFGYGP